MRRLLPFLPAVVLALGAGLLLGVDRQRAMPLREPLSEMPATILGFEGKDRPISPDEQRVAGMDSYVLREYVRDSSAAFSVYVGYYEQQTQGRTIHSPRNCLPGAGWEPLAVSEHEIRLPGGSHRVQRYLLAREHERALVYYWYQGRGRVSSNEYRVKWELLRDAALYGRTEEALVRIVVPLRGDPESRADTLATEVAGSVLPAVERALPTFPGRQARNVTASR
ncbi:MAG: exosortase C-terminal domain/associated protein EpsI [Gemmatimonadales bacterium]